MWTWRRYCVKCPPATDNGEVTALLLKTKLMKQTNNTTTTALQENTYNKADNDGVIKLPAVACRTSNVRVQEEMCAIMTDKKKIPTHNI